MGPKTDPNLENYSSPSASAIRRSLNPSSPKPKLQPLLGPRLQGVSRWHAAAKSSNCPGVAGLETRV